MHALLWEGDVLIGHAAVAQRQLIHGGRALRAGYVEGVVVRGDRRRRGHASALLEAIERIVRGAYDLGALSTTDDGMALYAGRGWQLWQGPTSALTPRGVEATPEDDGSVFVLPVGVELDLAGEITCDWREGDVW
jgi:aminoglycoside 2'-N-acetyltransferase I